MKLLTSFFYSEKGVFSALSALTIASMTGLMGVVLTLGNTFVEKNQFQSAVDLAAISGGSRYNTRIMEGYSANESKEEAYKTAKRILDYNAKHSPNMGRINIDYAANGDLQVSLDGAEPVMLSKYIGGGDKLNYKVFADVNVLSRYSRINFKSIDALMRAESNQTIEPLLSGLQITAYRRQGRNLGYDHEVLDDKNILKYFDSQCKSLRAIGYNTTASFNECDFRGNSKTEVLELKFTEDISYENINIVLSDIHVENPNSKRFEKFKVSVYTDNDLKINDFYIDSKGNVLNDDPDVEISAQPLNDKYKKTNFNRKGVGNHKFGLLSINLKATGSKPIKLVKIWPEETSFNLVSVNASNSIERPLRIVR